MRKLKTEKYREALEKIIELSRTGYYAGYCDYCDRWLTVGDGILLKLPPEHADDCPIRIAMEALS